MRHLLIIALLLSASCADDPGLIAPAPCACAEEDACGDDFCSFSFTLDESCAGKVSVAELLIDGHLESEPLRFPSEAPLVPCSRTAPGETSEIFVRGGSWLWGSEEPGGGATDPMLLSCETPGTIHQRTFECRDKVGD
ncbi:MAG: hypothetical protein VX938_02370, partial [Myxococcota bacterium]|nr:hypothetical protein [Myxococcota bacterium]